MTDARWPRVKELFQAAVELPVEERNAFVAAATVDDEALRREVESLLNVDTTDDGFLDRLPVANETGLHHANVCLSPSQTVFALVPTKSSRRLARAPWVTCIARAIRRSTARSP